MDIPLLMEKKMGFKMAMLKSGIYGPFLTPNPSFYKDSVNIKQEITYNKIHDKLHFNIHGGGKVLQGIYELVDKRMKNAPQ